MGIHSVPGEVYEDKDAGPVYTRVIIIQHNKVL